MYKNTAIALLAVLLTVLCASVTRAQSSASETAKTKAKITKLGVGADVTVAENGGKTFHGAIDQINADTFTMREVDLKANVEIRYDQVKHLDKGYTPPDPLTGKRLGKKTHRIIGFAALGVAVVAIIVLVVTLRDPNF